MCFLTWYYFCFRTGVGSCRTLLSVTTGRILGLAARSKLLVALDKVTSHVMITPLHDSGVCIAGDVVIVQFIRVGFWFRPRD